MQDNFTKVNLSQRFILSGEIDVLRIERLVKAILLGSLIEGESIIRVSSCHQS